MTIQKTQTEPTFKVECTIFIYGRKRIALTYYKCFDNGKQFGHMNDFQNYEGLSLKSVAGFIISKGINFHNVKKYRQCKTVKLYFDVIKELSNLIEGAN